jgi:hypothetical protein
MQQRGQGALSAKSGGREIPHNSWLEKAGAAAQAQQSGKACKNGSGRTTPQERGEDPLPT